MNQNRSAELWMRQVSFAGLHRILRLLAEYPNGLRAKDLDTQITGQGLYLVHQEETPAITTLYHCRNTLLHLSAVKRRGQFLLVNRESVDVEVLLSQPASESEVLSNTARDAFANLVLGNRDCSEWFFGLFLERENVRSDEFRREADTVTWNRTAAGNGPSQVILESERNGRVLKLGTHSERNAVLYGLRYWARDDLMMIDEFFHPKRGAVMYPILNKPAPVEQVVADIVLSPNLGQEWTVLSVRDLITTCCENPRRPISALFLALQWLTERFSGHFVVIPTSRSFATVNARGLKREELELRSYFQDAHGRYISHIRFHDSLRRLINDQARQKTWPEGNPL